MAIGNLYNADTIGTFDVDLAVDSTGIGENILVKLGSSSNSDNDVTVCGANEQAIGITVDDAFPPVFDDTTGLRRIKVQLFGPITTPKTITDITRGDAVGVAANGVVITKTIDTSAPATVIRGIGIALDASTAGTDTDTQRIRVLMTGGYIPV